MSIITPSLNLPDYQIFVEATEFLDLPFSSSELHGIICGYLVAGATREGVLYLSTLIGPSQEARTRPATLALFQLYAVSQQQLEGLGFEFQLLLPGDEFSFIDRAQAFTQWCDGFTQGIRMAEVNEDSLQDEDAQDGIEHITEFAELDYSSLQCDEEDEHALAELTEYTRMAVLHIHSDLQANKPSHDATETSH